MVALRNSLSGFVKVFKPTGRIDPVGKVRRANEGRARVEYRADAAGVNPIRASPTPVAHTGVGDEF